MADRSIRFPSTRSDRAVQNGMLLALPRKESIAVFSKLEFVELPTQTVLHEIGEPIQFAFFINAGLGSILNVMADGKSVEVGLSGKEGFVGIPLLVGLRTSPNRVVMQVAGAGFRMPARDVPEILRQCPALERALQRYAQELTMQATHVAACNRLHAVAPRLARWLLMSQDRLESEYVPLTQQFLAHMLGTRRASVTVAAGILQKAGLITYFRGAVKIENRRGLEAATCECYEMMRRQARRWQIESK
jgi:CRP-like cAMP-binding protein